MFSAEKIMHLDCIYITQHQVIGYTSRKKDNLKAIEEYLKKLNEREKCIMELRFGFQYGEEKTQKEVADMLGISQSYISRIEKKIIHNMKKENQSAGAVPPYVNILLKNIKITSINYNCHFKI